MARNITYRQAIHEALAQEMERDETVIVMGEDNAGGTGSPGEETPGAACSASPRGCTTSFPTGCSTRRSPSPPSSARPSARRGRAASGRRADVRRLHGRLLRPDLQPGRQVPVHVRRQGGTPRRDPHHVRRRAARRGAALAVPVPLFTHIPGLKVVIPSTPYDAKGLLIQAIRDNDPVIFFEHKLLYDSRGEVPGGSYIVPFGEASVVREGDDVTIVALGRMVHTSQEAAASWPRKESTARSSTCAPPPRWTRTPSSKASRKPAGWSWWTSRIRAAAWPPTSPRSSPRRPSAPCRRRSRR